ncbi:MAG: tetratricopeptide repeat protein [Clostridia bacterium]|nr:tetratricopeptide repeat protein [Clostridia bacterium]
MNDRNYQEAIRCFDKALRIDKTDECLVNSAVCYAKTGEYDEAERILSESNRGSVSGRYVQAEIAYAKKDFDEAITGFEYVKDNAQEEYLKRNAYVSLAEVYRDLRVDNPRDSFYLDKQIAVLEEALVKLKNRDDLTITEMLAGAYDSAQKYDLSVEKFRRLLELGYDREYIYLNLVKIHHKTDNLKEAEVVLKEMQEKYPESCDCYIQYARLYASIEADKSPEDRDYSKVYEYYLLAKKYNDDSKRNDDMDKLETEIQQLKDAGWLE